MLIFELFCQATVQDLDPPAALSLLPSTTVEHALALAYERDFTHLTVVSPESRALLGYVSIPRLTHLLRRGDGVSTGPRVVESDPVERAMLRFRRGKTGPAAYRKITLDTPLEQLEAFFDGDLTQNLAPQSFAIVTDEDRKFVLGVVTRLDLEEFVRRRPH